MKAVLVTFTQTVRMVVKDDADEEQVIQDAFVKAQETMSINGPNDSFEEMKDDTDVPFGTLEADYLEVIQ